MEKVERALLILEVILIPLVFWPSILSPFETPKMIVALVFILLTFIICSIKVIIKGGLSFKLTNLDLPIILLALIYVISALVKTPNKLDAFFVPGTALIIVLGVIYYFLASNLFSEKRSSLAISIFVSGVVVAVVSLLSLSGIFNKVSGIPLYFKNPTFSFLGGKLPEAILLISLLPLGIGLLIESKEFVKKVFWGVCVGVVVLSSALAIYNMLPGKQAAFALPSFKTSWAVSIDTLKESPFFGVGPGNYITAFNKFRPVGVNLSDTWSLKFSTSRSFLLTNLTETGIAGFIILVALLYAVYRLIEKGLAEKSKSTLEKTVLASIGLVALSFIFLPFYITTVFLFFLLLSMASSKREVNLNLKTINESKITSRIPAIAISGVIIGLSSLVAIYGAKLFLGELFFAKAILAVSNNDGKLAYDTIGKAIKLSPKVDKFHMSFSQMNIAVASAIAKNKDLKDTDKNTITQLIQQAISEAKVGVSLNPQRAGNWENLARIYQSIMPFAQGADNFAIQAYNQAIALDPINPDLRISLGGVYYALGRYDEAISAFQMATLAKNDLANAHYNLAASLRQKNEIERAIDEMNIVLSLVKKDSNDYKTAQTELENLQKKLPLKGTTESENLSLPQKQEQVIKPPIELPTDANPPVTP